LPAAGDVVVADSGGEPPPCTGFCIDAGPYSGPALPFVKDKIDRICSNADGCHGGGTAGNMVLHPGSEFDAMINVVSYEMPPMLRVKPGDPDNSYVYRKLACEGGIDGACMPYMQAFNPDYPRVFREWIEAGAPLQ
jgi:hypothetical protein